ncbi:FkbM family methyltransferase [Solidesulfovibrio sp.]|uniref:FkbM family methyltransferase n=1 Tax=Solidesulfovibrio sp. TaxID=2910990 RepID=UPI002B1F7B2F|nr:FkbM family methyltransferase [Solidesulfovibrio sp.]MEA5089539.1 FkbM family methyltransferase [Solidesulfovibrio sp.]
MSLEKMIREAPIWRPSAFPFWSRHIALACYSDEIPSIREIIGNTIFQTCKIIFLVDSGKNTPTELCPLEGSPSTPIPIADIGDASSCMDSDIVFFSKKFDYGKLVCGCNKLLALGHHSFFVHMPIPYNAGITTTHLPHYLRDNRENLEIVYAMLEDEESKRIFASRIRALITGNIGYIKLSRFPEYYHPQVRPQEGDIIIDGGLSENIGPELSFCMTIGGSGRLYGFEPDPIGFIKAYDQVQKNKELDYFSVIPFGLWDKKTTVQFTSAGVGSHVATGPEGVVVDCKMTTIDDFVKENRLSTVNFIKLDVEGSEFQALRAGIKTIVQHKPRMAVSLYHLPQDLYELPIFIKKILPDCKYFLGHHHASLHETILYVKPH